MPLTKYSRSWNRPTRNLERQAALGGQFGVEFDEQSAMGDLLGADFGQLAESHKLPEADRQLLLEKLMLQLPKRGVEPHTPTIAREVPMSLTLAQVRLPNPATRWTS